MASFMSFTLGDELYAVPNAKVREVIRLREVAPIAQAPRAMEGVMTLRGEVIPSFDLAGLLGRDQPTPKDAQSCAIIVLATLEGGEEVTAAFTATRVRGALSFEENEIGPAPAIAGRPLSPHLIALGRAEGGSTQLLDLDQLLGPAMTQFEGLEPSAGAAPGSSDLREETSPADAPPPQQRFLVVGICEGRFGLPLADIWRVIGGEHLQRDSLLEAPACGSLLIDAEPISVVDLAGLLGLESPLPMRERLLLVTRSLPTPVAFIVDRSDDIVMGPRPEIMEPEAGDREASRRQGFIHSDDGPIEILGFDRLLEEKMIDHLASWYRTRSHCDHIARVGLEAEEAPRELPGDFEELAGKYLIFRVGPALCALRGSSIAEIIPAMETVPVPGSDEEVRGMLDLRDRSYAVIDLKLKLGLDPCDEANEHPCIVLLHDAEGATGYSVDACLDLKFFEAAKISGNEDATIFVHPRLLLGTAQWMEETVNLLDAAALLSEEAPSARSQFPELHAEFLNFASGSKPR